MLPHKPEISYRYLKSGIEEKLQTNLFLLDGKCVKLSLFSYKLFLLDWALNYIDKL